MSFRFTIPVRLLREALPRLRAVVCRRSTLPVLECVLLSRHDGETRLVATDLDLSLTRIIPSQLPVPASDLGRDLLKQRFERENGSIAVPLTTLATIAKAADIESQIIVTDEGLRYKLGGNPVLTKDFIEGKEFPETPQPVEQRYVLSEEAKQGIIEALQCVSEDETRYVLNGVYLDPGKVNAIVTTDGRQLILTETPLPPLRKEGAIVPTKSVEVLCKHLVNWPWQLTSCSKFPRLFFHAGDWIMATKLIDGNFPNYRQVLPDICSAQEVIPLSEPVRKEILEVLQRLPVKSGTTPNDIVKLEMNGSKIIQFSAGDPTMNVSSGKTHSARHVRGVRAYWKRAVSNGFTELRVLDEFIPVTARKTGTTYIFMPCKAA